MPKVGVLIDIPTRTANTDDLAHVLKTISNSFLNGKVEVLREGDFQYSLKINGVPQPGFQLSVRN